jgi:CS domain
VVPVPKGTRARDLVVVIAKKKLSVGFKGKEPILVGDLCQDIKVEESTWTLGKRTRPYNLIPTSTCISEDQSSIEIHLEKVNKMQWWENVLTHHPKIDTRKIQPENSKLGDLDGETRLVDLHNSHVSEF